MEKVIYVLGSGSDGGPPRLGPDARTELSRTLRALGAHAVTANVVDADVEPARPLRMEGSGAPATGVISVWVDSATEHLRRPVDDAIATLTGTAHAAYLVTESVPVPNTRFPAPPGERTYGMAQLAFLHRRADLSEAEWFHLWLDDHTHVAIDLQDTFGYVQNVVARVLTPGAEPWDAIVEECFPPEAMADPHAFYDAADDDLLARRQRAMFDSVARFIDLTRIDVVPTSRYDLGES